MDFEIVSEIAEIETIATGKGVRDRNRLRKFYGGIRWRNEKELRRSDWRMVRVTRSSLV